MRSVALTRPCPAAGGLLGYLIENEFEAKG